MPRKALPKIPITPDLKEKQLLMRKFLRSLPNASFKEIRPHGFEIDTRTIPEDRVEEFLSIANIGYKK